jgi:nitroreductase
MLIFGCVMENMWLMAQKLGIGFPIMSVFNGPVQVDVRNVLKIPDPMAISFAVRPWGIPLHNPAT